MKKHICRWFPCLVVSAVLVPVGTASAAASIELRLADGSRVRVDRIGPETNGRRIALRVEADRVVMTRLVPWQRVVSARIGDQTFAREVLQLYFARKSRKDSPPGDERDIRLLPVRHESAPLAGPFTGDSDCDADRPPVFSGQTSTVPADDCCAPPARPACVPQVDVACERCYPVLPLETTVVGIREDPLSAYRDLLEQHFPNGVPVLEAPVILDMLRARKDYEIFMGEQPAATKRVPPTPLPPPGVTNRPIRNLTVRAMPISQHGKVDWDALAVEVLAWDRVGLPVDVRGTLEATLWGQKQRLVSSYGEYFFANPGRIEKIATWTRRVDPASSSERTNALVLPLPHPLPDHDLRRAAFGELHVKLAVPGEGVFETTERDILLRHRSPLRDRNLVETGSRFFAQESTYGGRMPGGLRFGAPTSRGADRRILNVQP